MALLSDAELKNLLEEIKQNFPQFLVTLKDLKTPKRHFMVAYFCNVMDEFGVDQTHILMPPELNCEYTDVVAHSLSMVKLLQIVKQLYPEKVGLLQNMGIDTLMDPKSSDIHYILAMSNFHRFVVNRLNEFAESKVISEQKEKSSSIDKVSARYNDMKRLVTLLDEEQDLREKEMPEIEDETNKCEQEIISLKACLGKDQEFIEAKEKEESMRREIARLQEKFVQEEEAYSAHSAHLVRSPQRIEITKQELIEKMQLLKEDVEKLSVGKLEEKKCSKLVVITDQVVWSHLDLLGIFQGTTIKEKEAKEVKLASYANDITQLSSVEDMKHVKIGQMKKKLLITEKVLEEYRSQGGTYTSPLEEILQQLEKKGEDTAKEFMEGKVRIVEKEAGSKKLKELYQVKVNTHKCDMTDFLQEKELVEHKINEFVEHSDQTWATIAAKEQEELRQLKEAAEEKIRQISSLIEERE